MTPLMAAVIGCQAPAAEELLYLGANVSLPDKQGDTVYHYAVLNCPPVVAVSSKIDRKTHIK